MELLVAIAIIAVLAALLFAAVSSIGHRPRKTPLVIFTCPSHIKPDQYAGDRHYAPHPGIFPWRLNIADAEPAPGSSKGALTRPVNLTRPAETLLVADGIQYGPCWNAHVRLHDIRVAYKDGVEANREKPLTGSDLGSDNDPSSNNPGAGDIRYRHGQKAPEHDGSANFLFADGHVAAIKYGELKEKNVRMNY